MATLITKDNAHLHRALIDEVYRFRHRFFVEHMKWETLKRADGREIDQFDGPDAVHIVHKDADGIFIYTRLLPTTGPHLLRDVYPEILQGNEAPSGPDVWEWTRAAIAPERRDSRKAADPMTGRMFISGVEAALYLGIRGFLVETHPALLTRSLEIGFDARPLALPTTYGGQPILALWSGVTDSTLPTMRRVFDLPEPLLEIDGRPVMDLVEERRLLAAHG
jgi:acyl-homoserine lactone synthase